MMQNSGPTGSSSRLVEPGLEFLPGPVVHADLAAAPALAAANEDRAAARVEVGLGERERFVDPQAGAPEHDDQPAQPLAVQRVAGGAHDRDDLLDRRRIGRVAHALVARRAAGVEAGHRRWRATAAGGIEHLRHRVLPRTVAMRRRCQLRWWPSRKQQSSEARTLPGPHRP